MLLGDYQTVLRICIGIRHAQYQDLLVAAISSKKVLSQNIRVVLMQGRQHKSWYGGAGHEFAETTKRVASNETHANNGLLQQTVNPQSSSLASGFSEPL